MPPSVVWTSRAESWRSGAWTLERRDDELADIRFRGRLVLRSVRAVVRDRDWNTPELRIERVHDRGGSWELSVRTEGFGAEISGTLAVTPGPERLAIVWRARSARNWLTNRTGLVALHPPRLAGTALDVLHSDGSEERSVFPRDISPHQPVFDIRELGWDDGGLHVRVRFSGDVFEMEDQRNWTDASFKTYNRPLALPFPYPLAEGEEIVQGIEISVTGAPETTDPGPARIALSPAGPFPEILTSASTAPDPAPAGLIAGRGGSERTLLVELDLGSPAWHAARERAISSGHALDVRIVLPQDDADAVTARSRAVLAEAIAGLRDTTVRRIAVFSRQVHTSRSPHVAALRAALAEAGISAEVLAGARSHFTELNREQEFIPEEADAVAFSSTPLFHARGSEQLIEAIGMQRLTAIQAVRIAGGRPVHIGPVTLRPRFNNVATAPEPGPSRGDLAEGYGAEFTGTPDDRQDASELGAWLIASAAAFAVPGVASICYFEEWGPRGLQDAAGRPTPAAAAFQALAALPRGELFSGASPDGLLWALGSSAPDGIRVLAANLSPTPRTVDVDLSGTRIAFALEPFGWGQRTS